MVIHGVDYDVLEWSEVLDLPDETLLYVGEVKRDKLGDCYIGIVTAYNVGRRYNKKVLYSKPYGSSYINIRNYKNKIYLRRKEGN